MQTHRGCSDPPSDTINSPTVCVEISLGVHRLRFGVVGQPEAELAVDLGLVGGVGLGEGDDDLSEGVDQAADLILVQSFERVGLAAGGVQGGLDTGAFLYRAKTLMQDG